jgi:hypothetical protein
MHNVSPAFAEMRRRNPVFRPNPRTALARAAATKQTAQIADVQTEHRSPTGYRRPGDQARAAIATGEKRSEMRHARFWGVR